MDNEKINIRPIRPEDNEAVCAIIQTVMREFNADPRTTVLGDPSIKNMFENYQMNRAVYFVAEINNKIIGGCGIKQLDGSEEKTCELQRMFLLPETRGKGIGKQLMEICMEKAKKFGYEKIYLESLKQMESAIGLYRKFQFREIKTPLGNTGHSGCNVWMIKELK